MDIQVMHALRGIHAAMFQQGVIHQMRARHGHDQVAHQRNSLHLRDRQRHFLETHPSSKGHRRELGNPHRYHHLTENVRVRSHFGSSHFGPRRGFCAFSPWVGLGRLTELSIAGGVTPWPLR